MKQYVKLFEEFVDSQEDDYTGEYDSLSTFLQDNPSAIAKFIELYSTTETPITFENYDDYIYGEIDTDDSIIENIIGSEYRCIYIEKYDHFEISKKKTQKIEYIIIPATEKTKNDIHQVIEDSGIHTEYEPAFAVIYKGKVIGGSTYKVEDGIYWFDVGIQDKYQGVGIFKEILKQIKQHAIHLNVSTLGCMVVNELLFQYLGDIGFSRERSNDSNYAYLDL